MFVLHVSQTTIAGVMAVLCDIVRDQLERGWRVAVACPSTGELPARIKAIGAEHVAWEASRSPGPSVFCETLRLKRCIKRLSPDVVHLHSSKAGLVGRLAIRGRVPTLFQPHAWSFFALTGTMSKAALLWERFGKRWADTVICVSESERQFGIDAGIDAAFCLARNGIALDRWPVPEPDDRRKARVRLGIQQHAAVAVCVGRVCRQKGQDLLIKAWSSVAQEIPAAELYIVGDGPDLRSLQTNSGDRIRFTGSRTDVRDWYLAADVVAMPSRWEGLSIAMLEAMATERPVIASDVAGMRETLTAGTGILVLPESVSDLAAAIIRLLNNKGLSQELGNSARLRVETDFDVRVTCETIADITCRVAAPQSAGKSNLS